MVASQPVHPPVRIQSEEYAHLLELLLELRQAFIILKQSHCQAELDMYDRQEARKIQ